MYVFCAGIGVVSGGVSGAVFGLNAIFSIVGYVVTVVILSAILDKDMGASEFRQYKYFVMCSMLFFGWIGSLCGGFFRISLRCHRLLCLLHMGEDGSTPKRINVFEIILFFVYVKFVYK